MRTVFRLVACLSLGFCGPAQVVLNSTDTARVAKYFDSHGKKSGLGCVIQPQRPFLDFAFRFETGYTVTCPIKVFDGRKAVLQSFLRVETKDRPPVAFGETYIVPPVPEELRNRVELRRIKAVIEASGGFIVGEGRYDVQLVLIDDRKRTISRRWKITAQRHHGEQDVQLIDAPSAVLPATFRLWDDKRSGRLRITLLLDAAPINPFALKLHAWDRAVLLNTISSVLREIPAGNVRVVAFNLDQQREIFRQSRFDGTGMEGLDQALRQLELGTVSYQTLKQVNGWADLISGLANQELAAPDPSDIVLFIGPQARIEAKPGNLMTVRPAGKKPRFYYLNFIPPWRRGSEFPDAIQHVTRDFGGSTFKVHSPGELAQAIRTITNRLGDEAENAASVPNPSTR